MNESIEELLASGAIVPDRPGSKRLVPAAQSVVVPLEDWRHVIGALKNAKARLPMGAAIGNVSDALSKVEHLRAAPAPSSLAGRSLIADLTVLASCDDMEVSHNGGDTNVGDVARRCLAALSPEAPAREMEWGYLFTDDDGLEWSPTDPRASGENQYAEDIRPASMADALLPLLDAIYEPAPVSAPEQPSRAAEAAAAKSDDERRRNWEARVNAAKNELVARVHHGIFSLTPRHEAPASEGDAVAFRDVFLSWHEECGTVERAGYGASPIGKFQSRWPGFHKKLWDAAMTSHDALRDAWVKVAKECEK